MKTKGTSAWEQYIEYVVLAVAIAVMAWFAWSTFGSKIESKVGRKTFTTSTVDEELIKAANDLKPKLSDNQPSPIEIVPPEPLSSRFSSMLAKSTSPNQRVIFPNIDMTSDIDVNQNVISELRMYVQPTIAAPEDIRMHQWFGTVDQLEMDRVPELSSVVDGPPNDTSWIQVAAKFDVDVVLQSFKTGEGEAAPIPDQWFNNGIDIFDVVIERQTLNDDVWTPAEVVSVLPGHLSYRAKIADASVDSMERDSIIQNLRNGKQSQIANPDFYALKGITPKNIESPWIWEGFTQLEESIKEDDETSDVKKRIDRLQGKIEKQEKLIEKIKEQIDEAGRGGGRGGPIGGGGNDGNKERLEKQLARAEGRLIDYLDDMELLEEELGSFEQGQEDVTEVVMDGDVWVWGHDLTAQTGETYRYRMTIKLANPFFGHKPSLYPEQKSLANEVTVPSVSSKWTGEIEKQKSKQWFVTGSNKQGGGISKDLFDLGHVSVDLFEFTDGTWNKNSVTVPVGQPLVTSAGVDSEWFVLDVMEDTSGEVVRLQNILSGEKEIYRPEIEAKSFKLRQLEKQVKQEQESTADDEDKEEDNDSGRPNPKPSGPKGGGGGGF
ncbi:MAG: hypothetical protein QF718_04700 [Phycisphaerales bacterium]|jgi:hypothetical protein|nr:hypothetical protein [Phycisphaerales bacterium]